MAFLLGVRLTRSFHASAIRFQLVNGAEKISDYKVPFDDHQKEKILEKINSLTETELGSHASKRFSKQIADHKFKTGEFGQVEQLLDLPKVEQSHLIKLCNSLLKDLSINTPEISGYKAPFDENQKEKILEKINSFSEAELGSHTSKRLSKQIVDYRSLSGNFDNVEKLLELPKVEQSRIEKFCNSLLKRPEISDYKAPFDEHHKEMILEKINSLSEAVLGSHTSKRLSKQITEYRNENGNFDQVEQLLSLPKVEESHVAKLCNSLVKGFSMQRPEQIPKASVKIKTYKSSGGISPKPESDIWSSFENPTIVGIGASLQGITYAKIDSTRKQHEWGALPGIENPNSQVCFQQRNLFFYLNRILEKIPEADYYVLEEIPPIIAKDPYLKHSINMVKLKNTLLTILMKKRGMNSAGVHTIKPTVLDNLFSLKVGNERVSIQNALERIINTGSEEQEETVFSVEISERSWNTYNKCSNQGKEYMASSLLKALAFNHVCREAK